MIDDELCERWLHYLADYRITTLFRQLGREVYRVPGERGGDLRVRAFEGVQVPAFTLRARARRLGYFRGETLDGPSFDEYVKAFPSVGLVAVIGFSGNGLPEENRTVGLRALSFRQAGPDGEGIAVRLGDVPPVLLAEAYDDLGVIAGSGGRLRE